MKTPPMQMTLSGWLILTAVIAFHIWLFQQSILWGFIGLTLAKHVGIAYLCHALGVDKDVPAPAPYPRPRLGPSAFSAPTTVPAPAPPAALARSEPSGYNEDGRNHDKTRTPDFGRGR